jgi:regulatory protein
VKSPESSSPERAYLSALRLLNARDYTVARLREKLANRGFDETHLETAVGQLVAEGWLNDLRFAARFTESALSSGRYYGPRLRQEMLRRGLPRELVSEVLGRIQGEYDEAGQVCMTLERRFSGFSFFSASDKEKRRVVGFLQRKGFSLSAIMTVLRTTGQ